MIVAIIPMAGAATNQNIKTNINYNANVDQALALGVTSQEALQMENNLQDKKPFGTNTEKVLAKTNMEQSNPNELKLGDSGDKVKKLQTWLKDYGFYSGDIDGQFGQFTETAVKNFQKSASIKVDGIVGKETRTAMKEWDDYLAEIQAKDTSSKSYSNTKHYTKQQYRRAYARYRGGYGYTNGLDCWGMSSRIYGQLTASGQKARIIQYATSMSSRHRSVQVYKNGAWVNYDYSGYSKIYSATSNSVNGKVVTSS